MIDALVELVAARQSFLLSGHEHPDGDCLGSQVALYHLLRGLGKQVVILNPDPITRSQDFLRRHTPFSVFDERVPLPAFDVAVLLDCAHLARLNALGERLKRSGAMIAVVDHHLGSAEGDGQVCYVDSRAPSTGALIYRLYRHLGLPIPAPAAEGVFLSLIADTGWFRYSNTDAEVFEIAADLVRSGVDAAALYDRMYRRNHIESVHLIEDLLGTHRFAAGGRYVYACLNKAAMAQAARIDFDTDMVLDPLRSVDGVEVVALFKERFESGVKVSLRATGDVNVRDIAAEFGGGGHAKAAGATLTLSMQRSVEVIEERVSAALADMVRDRGNRSERRCADL